MDEIQVDVVYVGVNSKFNKALQVPTGSSAQHALNVSRVFAECAELSPDVPIGIYGQKVSRDHILRDGDRIEIYRPLVFDPKQARRNRAARKGS